MGIRISDFAFIGHSRAYATRDVRLIANLCFHPNHPKIGRAVQSMANLMGRFIQLFNRNYVIGLVRQDAISYIASLASERTGGWAKRAKPELIVPLRIGAEGSKFSSPGALALETRVATLAENRRRLLSRA